MSKENLRKHTSIKNGLPVLERRESREDLREQPAVDSDPKVACSTEQSEVMKKIQNKLRMRKRSTNLNTNDRLTGTPPDLSSTGNISNQQISEMPLTKGLQAYDLSVDIPETVEKLMDKDENINEKITLARVDKEAVKDQLIKDSTFILCQLNKGRKMEDILLERVSAIIESNKVRKRIEDKERSIMAMMDDRIKKLMMMQKPLVH